MLKYFFMLFALSVVVVVSVAGFRGQHFKQPPIEIFPDMDHQPKVKAQVESRFFADGRASRRPVAGTVPLGYAVPLLEPGTGEIVEATGPYSQIAFSGAPDYYNTGVIGDQWGTGMPFTVTPEIMERGRERYQINCAVCHGDAGDALGVAPRFGLAAVASLHQDRLREMADGELYDVITNGRNTMMAYGHNIQVPDRWAIVAYVRALQRAQNAGVNDVPPAELAQLQEEGTE